MIIFQTASGSNGGGIIHAGLFDKVTCTTFKSSEYIHNLNRTLQSEMRAIATYQNSSASGEPNCSDKAAEHQHCARELVRIIIANRGIPEDATVLKNALLPPLVKAYKAFPDQLQKQMLLRTLLQIEKRLHSKYESLIDQAPSRDRLDIRALANKSELRIEEISKLLS